LTPEDLETLDASTIQRLSTALAVSEGERQAEDAEGEVVAAFEAWRRGFETTHAERVPALGSFTRMALWGALRRVTSLEDLKAALELAGQRGGQDPAAPSHLGQGCDAPIDPFLEDLPKNKIRMDGSPLRKRSWERKVPSGTCSGSMPRSRWNGEGMMAYVWRQRKVPPFGTCSGPLWKDLSGHASAVLADLALLPLALGAVLLHEHLPRLIWHELVVQRHFMGNPLET